MLAQFQTDRAKQEAKFARLEAKARAQERARAADQSGTQTPQTAKDAQEEDEMSFAEAQAWEDLERLAKADAGLEPGSLPLESEGPSDSELEDDDECLSVDEWRQLVTEDFQQSQFWYSTPFAYHLADCIHSHLKALSAQLGRRARIAFLCSPTAFVAFQDRYGQRSSSEDSVVSGWQSGMNLFMFEIDERFIVAARNGGFVKYDFNTPLKGLAEMRHSFDMVVIDPPFLNEKTTLLVAQTVHHILQPPTAIATAAKDEHVLEQGGSILLLTGERISAFASKTYPFPGQPPLAKTAMDVQHDGGRLSNEFGAWASWRGAGNFGS